jgi:pectate disaccharide-lyase
MKIRQILISLLLITGSVFSQTTVYVDPVNGNDGNTGTIGQPLKTLAVAIPKVTAAGGYVYLRGGTYTSGKISLSRIATASSTIKIWAYNNELPIIDFGSAASGEDGFSLSGNYYHFKGLELIHAPHNAIKCTGNYNIIEACKIHSNSNTGLAIGSSGTTYPRNNLILNCDSYLNFDAPLGADADGFSAKWNIGAGNVFKGCRAWQNSDDGWDLWMAIDTVEIDSCFAFRNGVNSWGVTTLKGNNGNGFKLGGNDVATHHIVKNCVSFDNAGDTGTRI